MFSLSQDEFNKLLRDYRDSNLYVQDVDFSSTKYDIYKSVGGCPPEKIRGACSFESVFTFIYKFIGHSSVTGMTGTMIPVEETLKGKHLEILITGDGVSPVYIWAEIVKGDS